MLCPKCSRDNSDSAKYCMHCGAPLSEEKIESRANSNEYRSQYRAGDRYQPHTSTTDRPPMSSWLAGNIVLTVISVITCSCISLIFAAIGIGFSAQVGSRFRSGDMEGAGRAASTARTLFWIALIVGILTLVAYGILVSLGIAYIPGDYFERFIPYFNEYNGPWQDEFWRDGALISQFLQA